MTVKIIILNGVFCILLPYFLAYSLVSSTLLQLLLLEQHPFFFFNITFF